MATNFPTSLDAYSDPQPTDPTNAPSHAGNHTNHNDAIEAIEAKVGIDGSAVTSSLDYQMENHAHTAGADDGGVIPHSSLSGIGASDHHSNANDHLEAHTVASHSDTTATGAELETLTDGSNADALHIHSGGTVAHSSTTGQTANDHHAQSHAHNGADSSGTVAHSATTGRTANDHHNQAHSISGADHTGSLAHSSLSGVTADQHHSQAHTHRMVIGPWERENLAASLTNDPIRITMALAGSRLVIPYACEILAMAVRGTGARTAGTATFKIRKNGSGTPETPLQTSIDGTNTQAHYTTATAGNGVSVSAGDDIDVVVSTTSGWSPTSNNYLVTLWLAVPVV